MKLFYRRFVLIIFILIFLILSPVLVLYSEGYRYNFQKAKIQKTGMLIVSSVPKKADIYLDGQKVMGQQTPARIQYLLPADYELKLSKADYHDWQKKLPVYDNLTTFAEKIILWKDVQPQLVTSQNLTSWLASPGNKNIAQIDENNNLQILDTASGKIDKLPSIKNYSNIKLIGWSQNENKLIISADNGKQTTYYLASKDIFNISLTNLTSLLPANPTSLNWDNGDSDIITSENVQGIWQVNLLQKTKTLIAKNESPDSFLTANNNLYLFENQAVYNFNINDKSLNKISDLHCDGCHFITNNINKLVLWDKTSQQLALVDPENKVPTINATAKNLDWLIKKPLDFFGPQNNSLLFYNDWEIWIFNPAKGEPELITRFGQKIDAAVWHPLGRHIVFANDNKIKIIELDNRELRNIIDLATVNNLKNLTVGSNGNELYFNDSSTTTSSADIIFKLQLQ